MLSWVKEEKASHKSTELIFVNRDGKIMTKSGLRKRMESYLVDLDIFVNNKKNKFNPIRTDEDKKLTINRFTQYDLRHTFATILANVDAPIRKVTALMDYGQSSTTEMYYTDREKFETSNVADKIIEYIDNIESSDSE